MKSLLRLILLVCLLSAQFRLGAAGQPASLLQSYPKLTLKDGQVLRDVRFTDAAYDSDGVMVHCSRGMVRVAYNLFPDELQPALATMRPLGGVIVRGDFVDVKPAPPPEIVAPNAPPPVPSPINYHFGGQLNLAHPGEPDRFLADVTVSAIHPDVFAAYQKQWLGKYADLFKTLGDQFRAADPSTRLAAYAKATIVIYGSMDPLPESLAETRTDSKGRFDLACTEHAVFLLIRTHLPLEGKPVAYIWALPVQSGPPLRIGPDNLLLPYDYQYEGRVNIGGADQPARFLPNVSVYAVKPGVFEDYNRQRLEKYGAAIDALSAQIRTADPSVRAATYARATVLLYGSMDPLPPVVAQTRTDAQGRFSIICNDPAVTLIARTHLPLGQNQVAFVWAAQIQPGSAVELNLDNMLLKY